MRVRTELMPLLESLGSGVVGHLCALADQLTSAQKPSLSLPRATQAALSQLAAGGRGEVRLPGGLVVRAEPKKRPSEGQTGVAGQSPDCEEV